MSVWLSLAVSLLSLARLIIETRQRSQNITAVETAYANRQLRLIKRQLITAQDARAAARSDTANDGYKISEED